MNTGISYLLSCVLLLLSSVVMAQSDSVFIKATDHYNMYSLTTDCSENAPSCMITVLKTSALDGKEISLIVYSSEIGDCTDWRSDESLILNDSLLIILHTESKGNCSEEEWSDVELTVKEYRIKDSGEIVHDRSRNVNRKRENYELSTRLFSEKELREVSKEDLAVMRNELYAAHGCIFKNEKWANYFLKKPWYKPVFDEVPDYDFSLVELMNLKLIKRLGI